jgi:hypothetical protein
MGEAHLRGAIRAAAGSRSGEHIAHRLRVPSATARRADAARVQRLSDLVQGRGTRALHLPDDWKHVGGVTICECSNGHPSGLSGYRELRAAELDAPCLRSR